MSNWPEKLSICDVEVFFIKVIRNGECNLATYRTKSGGDIIVEQQIKYGEKEPKYVLFSNQTPRFL